MNYSVEHAAIIILAAGISSRMGSPKQLITYKRKSLLRHAVESAMETAMRPVIVVLGAYCDEVKKEIQGLNVELIENREWQEGMASSLRCGLAAVQKMSNDVDGIIFMVCDQPFVTKSLLNSLLHAQNKTGFPIVASSYEGNVGTPALFHKSLFPKLMDLKGDTGARKLMRQHESLVATVAFPKGIIDIDTKADYEALVASG